MSTAHDFKIHSELRSGHWVSWITTGSETTPSGAVLLVGQTKEEAESNAKQWAGRLSADPRLLRVSKPLKETP